MRARIIPSAEILRLVDWLRRDYEVIAPFRGRGRDSHFDFVTDANRGRLQVHLPNPQYPPKRYVFPHLERLFRMRRGHDRLEVEPSYHPTPRAIWGIRSCDLAGIWHLDRFYLGREPRDIYYDRRRR